ncbi:formylmethanofuran dehydrogenase subunit E region [Caldicellulosiruptor owensensis OL]|uniref:Formylmethanofuran dehydrogenase subunit E region n=1 Tax=Caldicellulosiruptor owensensis (strain ATCC 700167 / DSM 13100 / OL) TaxID=632518 RepID=E4Q2P8_CALOW|nr:FmdE family protein [Caldicellulosiruptor owensensis]ADQ03802.1 formylmethanofuran dehydrogenase subunit E region [Caldicellulosiruptor owensensis OL]
MKKELWQKCVEFHGHSCPGLAIGFRACEAATEKLDLTFSKDEEVVCITETDACGVDAIQVILGTTIGKGNLILKDRGKHAFTFFRRDTNEGIRVVFKGFEKDVPREERLKIILSAPLSQLFELKQPKDNIPPPARIFKSIECTGCGEKTAENKIRVLDGKFYCLDCFEEYSRGWER